MGQGQRGAVLAYVLGILAVFGLMIAGVLRSVRFNDSIVSRDRWDAQARLLAAGGLDFALSRIAPPGKPLDLAYATEKAEWQSDNPHLSFTVRVAEWGLFARAVSRGKTKLPLPGGREKRRSSWIGQELDLGEFPALGLLNREGNLVLAGSARIDGPVLLWRGGVRKATDYAVRAGRGAAHRGAVWDSTAPAWSRILPDFRRVEAWVARQQRMLEGFGFSKDGDYDSGQVVDWSPSDSVRIADTTLIATRIRAAKAIVVESGAVLRHCKLLAPEIRITGNSRLHNSLTYASRNLNISGSELQGGFFAANDTLSLASDFPLTDWPTFYVQGRSIRTAGSDSAYVGLLHIGKVSGEGLFFSANTTAPKFDQQIRMNLEKNAVITGLLYCGGYARIEGRVLGSVLCRNLRFEHMGTIWLGHLMDAELQAPSAPFQIPAPLLFPAFPVLAFGEPVP